MRLETPRPIAAMCLVLRYVAAVRSEPRIPAGAVAFSAHHNGFMALVWTVVVLSVFEIVGVHLVLRHWSPVAALVVSTLSVIAVAYLVGVGNALRCLPTLVTETGIRLRLGVLIDEAVAWDGIATCEAMSGAPSPRTAEVLRVAALSPPNVRIEFTAPVSTRHLVRGAKLVRAAELYVDDPQGFLTAVRQRPDRAG